MSHHSLASHVGLTLDPVAATHACLMCRRSYTARAHLQHTIANEVVGRICRTCAGPHFQRVMAKLEQQPGHLVQRTTRWQ